MKAQRYQIYLNPDSVAIIDNLENAINISRSKQIRELVDLFANTMVKLLARNESKPRKRYILDELAGFIDLKTKKKTNYAIKHDSIYLKD